MTTLLTIAAIAITLSYCALVINELISYIQNS